MASPNRLDELFESNDDGVPRQQEQARLRLTPVARVQLVVGLVMVALAIVILSYALLSTAEVPKIIVVLWVLLGLSGLLNTLTAAKRRRVAKRDHRSPENSRNASPESPRWDRS
ncbi:beta-lactamase regulating signal transducer with metallopeptidase domain [Friedmanniella endophytica]|uniref:Beta-lactamase regulating signal transducer with metallopeptidase domain n=1 Tax=Microlunatus kandeliicorticis TaxID=1759536 RepID=A0A7W3IRL9_9ACTN|nr:hypothetical protein [Microlunatus kandeliicorticis]MBA8793967.1 beta-lactamase regulating signal transducer with metallopeptidase domain [Microlunatus kandeliicorticis]